MERKETIETVLKLIQLNTDAVYAYDQALDEIEDEIMRDRLAEFRNAHREHAERLCDLMRTTMGTAPPKPTKDFKGFLMEAFTALSGVAGMKGSLKALQTTEKITNQFYGEIVSKDLPSEVKEILRVHFTEEKIHLDYIRSNLEALR